MHPWIVTETVAISVNVSACTYTKRIFRNLFLSEELTFHNEQYISQSQTTALEVDFQPRKARLSEDIGGVICTEVKKHT